LIFIAAAALFCAPVNLASDSIMKSLFNIFRVKARRDMTWDACRCARKARQILIAVACVLGMCTTISANATCSFTDGSFATGNVNFGGVTVPPNVAVGTVIATVRTYYYDVVPGQQRFWCGSNVPTTVSYMMSGTGSSGIYATNIPGIGIRIKQVGQGYAQPANVPMPYSYTWTPTAPFIFTNTSFTFELVVTGPVDFGGTSALSYDANPWLVIQPTDGSAAPLPVANLVIAATLTARSCSVTTPSVSVPLPTVFPGNFATGTVGATPFNLGVNCAAGAKVYVTLTDASNVSNTSTTLGLAPGSSASGIGLQILNGSTPVAYGADSAMAGNTHQWLAGAAAGGPMTIPLTVQYVRTSGALIPGTVKGTATFTMSYQ
jgi:type 1 fimbria pilin